MNRETFQTQGWHTKSFSTFSTLHTISSGTVLHTKPLAVDEDSSLQVSWGAEFWDEERDTNTIDEGFDLLSLFTPTVFQGRVTEEEVQLYQSYYLGAARRTLLLMLSSGGAGRV
jgi:hypothetical protein